MVLKKFWFIILLWSVGLLSYSKVFFSHQYQIRDILLHLIDNEHKHIYAALYMVTDKAFVAAIQNAVNRGVQVDLILDAASYESYGKGKDLENAGAHCLKYSPESKGLFKAIMHNKVWLFEKNSFLLSGKTSAYFVTGSYNPTMNAHRQNLENIFITDEEKSIRLATLALGQLEAIVSGRALPQDFACPEEGYW